MKRKNKMAKISVLILFLLLLAVPASAMIPVYHVDLEEPEQNAIIGWNGGEEVLILSTNVEYLMGFMEESIRLIPVEEFEEVMEEAEKISPDPDDAPYLALALKFFCPMWSNDKRLREQNRIKVLNTPEVSKLLGIADTK